MSSETTIEDPVVRELFNAVASMMIVLKTNSPPAKLSDAIKFFDEFLKQDAGSRSTDAIHFPEIAGRVRKIVAREIVDKLESGSSVDDLVKHFKLKAGDESEN